MQKKNHHFLLFCFLLFFAKAAQAVTLTSGQTDYTTTGDITTSSTGISSTLVGTSSSLNKITNTYTITTGNSGGTSSAYGIKVTGNYNQITNDTGAAILTTGSSGRGVSVANYATVINSGSVTTQGTTSYGIYAGGDSNTVTSSGSITTANTSAYGIYLNGDSNSATNSGSIATQVYGIYANGNANQITNSGTIATSSSSSAHGIYVSAGSSSTASSSSYSTVNNSGTISSLGSGIYAKDNYTQITNSGTITTSGSSIYGIRTDGDNSTITNSGSVTGTTYAIYNSGAGTVINNSGTLSGGVLIGNGTLNILGGSISGAVNGSSGTGSLVVGSSSYPSITFNQTADFSDLNTLTIQSSSTLNSSASISASSILIDTNSTLTLSSGSSVSGAITGVSDSAGTLNISGISFAPSSSIGISGNALANLNISSSGSLSTSSNIYASEIALEGTLNFYGADNLTIAGDVTGSGSGAINVGSQSQTISGDFTLTSGDEMGVTLKSGGVGNLTVSGLAAIDSNSKLAITTSSSQGYIADGTQYSLVSAGSGSSINAISDSNISVNGVSSNIYGFLKFSTSATSDSLVLNIDRLSATEITSNTNAQNIYQTLTDIGSSSGGKLLEFQEYLDSSGLTGNAVTNALNQLAPQSSKAALATTNNVVSNSIKITESRLEKTRRSDAPKVLKNGFWVQGFGGSAEQKEIENDVGYKASLAGLSFGIDQEVSDSASEGVAFSVAKSGVKSSDGLQQNLIDTYQINFYRSQNFEKYFLDAIAGLAWNHFDSNRAITALNLNAMSGYSGQTYALKMKTGWRQNFKHGFSVSPETSLNFLRNNISGYNEKGADELNLDVESVSANFLEGRVGFGLGYVTRISEFPEFKKVATALKISYGYAFVNDAPTTMASFHGQSKNFNSQISHVDSGSFKIGTEFVAYHQDDSTFEVDYGFEKRESFESQLILVKVRQEF